MGFVMFLLVAGLTFGLCYVLDKSFTKVFRGKAQHQSGLSVRLSKHYGGMGLVLGVIGLSAVFTGLKNGPLLIFGGIILVVLGVCLVIYYMTFGIFYDEEGFILTTFGRKSQTYYYRDIQSQQLYNNAGTILIELFLKDGRSVHLQATMTGVYPFMDKAFAGWLRQTGKRLEDCEFHDPQNSCWFPPVED